MGSDSAAADGLAELRGALYVIAVLFPVIFVWKLFSVPAKMAKVDADKIAALSSELERLKKQDMLGVERSVAHKKLELAKQLSAMNSLAIVRGAWAGVLDRDHAEKYFAAQNAAKAIIEEFTYDAHLRTDCLDFIQLCNIIAQADKDREPNEKERVQLHQLSESLMKRLHSQG